MWVLKCPGDREVNILFDPGVRIKLCPGRVVATPTRKQQFTTTNAFGGHMLSRKLLLRHSFNRECGEANRAGARRLIVPARANGPERFRAEITHIPLLS